LRSCASLLLVCVTAALAWPQDAVPHARLYQEQVLPFLVKHCKSCHSGAKPKGDLKTVQLSAKWDDEAARERWELVKKRLMAGEMPPKDEPRPDQKAVTTVVTWIDAGLRLADAARAKSGRAVMRRLNRLEYENSLRDLLGIEVEVQDMLPADASAGGFDNVGSAHHSSSFLLEKYLEAADLALSRAISNGPQPPVIHKRYLMKDERHVKSTTERVFRHRDDGLVMFSSSAWQAITLSQFYPPDRGVYRVRMSVSGFQSQGKPVTFRVEAGPMLMGTKSHLVGYFDAAADKPTTIEFTRYFEARSTMRILPFGLASAQQVHKIGADQYDGPGLNVHEVEVEGPLHSTWPPDSHRRIFGNLPQASAPAYNFRNRVEVMSKEPVVDAERILRGFVRRAFRRAVTDDDVKPFVKLVASRLDANHSFEQAMRAGLAAVLMSPDFLFLREPPGRLNDFALASRLSYFLWSSPPDEELLTLAEQKKLSDDAVLREQVERLLKHPKAATFVANFVSQWLGLRDIDFTEPSHILYPEFDHMLKVSMVREAELFFAELIKSDLSLTNIVASDFTMLNGRLARHYGVPGIDGWEFRKTTLPQGTHRGGVMTMAGVLKVTANGTSTSPVVRGAWVQDRILGTPPPKPPPDIPAVEPDIRGATTIREQLAKHRQLPSCASCHRTIDPPGFALESFDVIGGWRDHYRTTGRGKPVILDGRRMHYLQGPAVDPADALADGSPFKNIDELKALLLRDKDRIARALCEKLVTYATGALPNSADQANIDAIVAKTRSKDYGTRTLVHEIIQSELFRRK